MQHAALRMSAGHTWIGRPSAPDPHLIEEEDRTVRGVFLGPEAEEERTARGFFLARPQGDEDRTDHTVVERASSTSHVGHEIDRAVFTADMLAELRRRLREAEAREAEAREAEAREAEEREGSGVRLRPTADCDEHRGAADLLADLEIDVEEPRRIDELEATFAALPATPLPTLEVALAPNSESNFYAGFDDEHPDGVFLATYSRLGVGAPVYLDVLLPAGYRFRTPALVEWVRPPEAAAAGLPAGIGFSMCGLDDSTRRLIRSFARHRKPLFYVG